MRKKQWLNSSRLQVESPTRTWSRSPVNTRQEIFLYGNSFHTNFNDVPSIVAYDTDTLDAGLTSPWRFGPSMSHDHATVCAWGFAHPGNFSFAPAEIRDSNVFWCCSIIFILFAFTLSTPKIYTSRIDLGSLRKWLWDSMENQWFLTKRRRVPIITCETAFSEHVIELVFGVNIFDLNLGVQVDFVVFLRSTSAFDNHFDHSCSVS